MGISVFDNAATSSEGSTSETILELFENSRWDTSSVKDCGKTLLTMFPWFAEPAKLAIMVRKSSLFY